MIPSKQIQDLAKAIAHAEGFGIPNAVPTRAHNPGDLKVSGFPVTGDEGITIFPSDEVGWQRLYHQLILIKSEQSHVYSLQMTFYDFSRKWTDTFQTEWMSNVLSKLREFGYKVDELTTLFYFFEMTV